MRRPPPDAPLPLHRRLLEALTVAGGLSVLYFAAGNVPPTRQPIVLPFEAAIPFVPEAVWAYLPLYALIFVITLFTVRDTRDFRATLAAFAAAGVLAFPVFLGLPIAGPRPPSPDDPTLTAAMIRWLHANDPVGNTLPSLHVANSTLCAWACWRARRSLGLLVGVFAAAIAASTLLLKQHWVVDLPAGVALAWAGTWAAWAWRVAPDDPRFARLMAAPARLRDVGRGSGSPARGDR